MKRLSPTQQPARPASCDEMLTKAAADLEQASDKASVSTQAIFNGDYAAWKMGKKSHYDWMLCSDADLARHSIGPSCDEMLTNVAQDLKQFSETGVSAQALLDDDYAVWKDGGKSFADWCRCSIDDLARHGMTAKRLPKAVGAAALAVMGKAAPANPEAPSFDTVPIFDVEAGCQTWGRVSPAFNQCRNEEQDEYNTLKVMCSNASRQSRGHPGTQSGQDFAALPAIR